MNVMNRHSAIRFLLTTAVAIVAAVGSTTAALGQPQSPTFKVGGLYPLTGPNAVYGDIFVGASDLAIDDVNTTHTINGKLVADYADTQALPQPAVAAMNKLVQIDKVQYVLTSFSGVSKAVAPIGNRDHVILVNGGGSSPELALGGYFLNDIPLVNDEIKVLFPYVVNDLKLKRIGVIHVNDVFGNSTVEYIKQECKELGCTVVSDVGVDPLATSFQSEAIKLRAANPDAVYIASYGQQQSVIAKQLRDGGVGAQLLSYSAFGIPSTIKTAAAQGTLLVTEHLDYSASERGKAFLKAFEQKYKTQPGYLSANYYNAVLIYADLIKHLQTSDQEITGQNLLKTLHEIKTFKLAGATITFRSDGTIQMPMEINKVVDQKLKTIKVVTP